MKMIEADTWILVNAMAWVQKVPRKNVTLDIEGYTEDILCQLLNIQSNIPEIEYQGQARCGR